ncbi:MAG: mechanosensitive ion channel family protein [Trueperaceae bacterium]|nr:mechanosensitive ion channel family protein [Trueperaceae bacterium]
MTELLAPVGDALGWIGGALAEPARLGPAVRAVALFVAGLVLAGLSRRMVGHLMRGRRAQSRVLMVRTARYVVLGLFTVSALRQLGFDFTVILGAAGILTAAVAFASQTSASNMISGLFLGLERSVEIGDVIKVSGITGEVRSIDLLSTRLRTFDNLLVRIPNETMVRSEVTNVGRYPIRRYDLPVGVAYDTDLTLVKRILMEVADRNPLALEEPAPLIIAQGYGASSIDVQFSVWAARDNYLEVRNQIHQQVKEAFDREGIVIPFPHVTLHDRPRDDGRGTDGGQGDDADDDANGPSAPEEGTGGPMRDAGA